MLDAAGDLRMKSWKRSGLWPRIKGDVKGYPRTVEERGHTSAMKTRGLTLSVKSLACIAVRLLRLGHTAQEDLGAVTDRRSD